MTGHASRATGALCALAWLALTWPALAAESRTLPFALAAVACAVAAGGLLLVPRVGARLVQGVLAPRRAVFVAGAALVGALISWAVVRGPMRGQPLSLDGVVYLAEARALTHGSFGLPMAFPRMMSSLRFFFEGADGKLHGVFAPGFPLALAPFVAAGGALLAGPATAAALVVASYALARSLTRDELASRVAVLLSLGSWARAIETADLLSHAWLALLSAMVVRLGLSHLERPGLVRPALIGALVAWSLASRPLDGAVLAAFALALLVVAARRSGSWARPFAVAAIAGLPFVALVAAQQHAATGTFSRATVVEYASRSDYPADCARLGLGKNIGCTVEHHAARESFGDDGYGLDDALRVASERAGLLGRDVLGLSLAPLVAFAWLARRGGPRDALAAGFVLALTLAYALFYYGSLPIWGARHLFPATPFLYALLGHAVSRGLRRNDAPAAAAPALGAIAAAGAMALPAYWIDLSAQTDAAQARRVDVRAAIEREHVERGIVATTDTLSMTAAYDPWRDGDDLRIVFDNPLAIHELRRSRPDLPVLFAWPPAHLDRLALPAPTPELSVELERAWPSLQRPHGVGASAIDTTAACGVATSGDWALFVFEASPGGSIDLPFDVALAGRYALRVDGLSGPDYGEWDLLLDGEPLAPVEGYAPSPRFRRGIVAAPRDLSAGPHQLTARCSGKSPDSTGYRAAFDRLTGDLIR